MDRDDRKLKGCENVAIHRNTPKRPTLLSHGVFHTSLSGSGFTTDDDALILLVCVHIIVGALRNGENMGRDLCSHKKMDVIALISFLDHKVQKV
jgi:hypothetical protein